MLKNQLDVDAFSMKMRLDSVRYAQVIDDLSIIPFRKCIMMDNKIKITIIISFTKCLLTVMSLGTTQASTFIKLRLKSCSIFVFVFDLCQLINFS